MSWWCPWYSNDTSYANNTLSCSSISQFSLKCEICLRSLILQQHFLKNCNQISKFSTGIMIITNSKKCMIIYMKVCDTKGVLGSWKLWFSFLIEKKSQNQNFGSFSEDFLFRAEGKKVTSRAKLKILQLELWLESARLGLTINTCLGKCVYFSNFWVIKLTIMYVLFDIQGNPDLVTIL